MPDPAALGAGGDAPLTAGDWRDAARAVAVARRAGAAAVSVRHITFHLSTLDFKAGQTHAHMATMLMGQHVLLREAVACVALASDALVGIAPALRRLLHCQHRFTNLSSC